MGKCISAVLIIDWTSRYTALGKSDTQNIPPKWFSFVLYCDANMFAILIDGQLEPLSLKQFKGKICKAWWPFLVITFRQKPLHFIQTQKMRWPVFTKFEWVSCISFSCSRNNRKRSSSAIFLFHSKHVVQEQNWPILREIKIPDTYWTSRNLSDLNNKSVC